MATLPKPNELYILTLNAYLVDPITSYFSKMTTCINLHQRAIDTVKLILDEQFDLVNFQEMWGAEVEVVQNGLQTFHSWEDSYSGVNLASGMINNLINSARNFFNGNGGLFTTWKPDILQRKQFWKKTFSISESKSGKGITAHLFELRNSSEKEKKYLLNLNTHLDPLSLPNKKAQCGEIYSFLGEICDQIKEKASNFDFSSMIVLLSGDFNIDSNYSTQYRAMVKHLTDKNPDFVVDLFHQYDPVNWKAPTYSKSKNPLVQWDEEYHLDYLFNYVQCKNYKFCPVKVEKAEILEKVFISDHFPLIWKISY